MTKQVRCFTYEYNSLSPVLSTEVGISQAHDPRVENTLQEYKKFKAIWDTGATGSVVTRKVVDECGLQPVSVATVHTVGGSRPSNVYYVNFELPNEVIVAFIPITEGDIYGADALIGMDIINLGDFAISNLDNKTVFTFRLPSVERFNFVKTPVPGYSLKQKQLSPPPHCNPEKTKHPKNKPCHVEVERNTKTAVSKKTDPVRPSLNKKTVLKTGMLIH